MTVASGKSLDPGAVRAAADAILGLPGADSVEVVVTGSDTALTRYARSEVIQNTVRRELRAQVRVVVGEKVAAAATNQLDQDSMKVAAARALEATRSSRPDPDFPGLPSPSKVGRAEALMRWDQATASASPAQRAERVAELVHASGSSDAAGIFETSAHYFGVLNSQGIDCWDAHTRCVTSCLVDEGGTGWGERSSHAMSEVDVEAVARTAATKARLSTGPVEAEAGPYEVVLEPSATALLLDYLSYVGLGAKQVIDGESFLSTRRGEEVAAPSVTVADDVYDPLSVGIGFDLEGVPRKKVSVIKEGRAVGPVTDLRTAPRLGLAPTGHFSGSTEFGPYASNVVLRPGDKAPNELIEGVRDGVLVTRFHYVNVLDRPSALLTGMTRDGTFRIRDGEVAEPVHNFRFSQSVLDALRDTVEIGADASSFAPDFGSFGSTVAPSLRVGSFFFASTTSH
jgi:PmbA protein